MNLEFLRGYSMLAKTSLIICVHCDNQSAIGMTQSSMYNGKFRHIHHRYNIVKHLLSNRIVSIDYVKSNKNIMDPLTKDLSRELVYNSSRGMSLKPLNLKECNDGNHTKLIGDSKIYVQM